MTSYETERALVHFAEQIIKTFGKEIGIQDLIQGQKELNYLKRLNNAKTIN